jgi:anti-sigma factor RsiW
MLSCRLAELLVKVRPLSRARDLVLRRHTERCPRCAERLLSRAEARAWLVQDDEVEDDPRFWPAVRAKIRRDDEAPGSRVPTARPLWQRAAAVAGFLFLAGAGFWLYRELGRGSVSTTSQALLRFRVNSLTVGGEPAAAVVIQPPEPDLVIVWVDKTPPGQ